MKRPSVGESRFLAKRQKDVDEMPSGANVPAIFMTRGGERQRKLCMWRGAGCSVPTHDFVPISSTAVPLSLLLVTTHQFGDCNIHSLTVPLSGLLICL